MIKRLFTLLFAVCLLVGCSKSEKASEPQEHTVALDQLSITIPKEFSPVTLENGDQVFMYGQDKMYIYGYKENKQELISYMQQQGVNSTFISLGSYVQTFTESFVSEASPAQKDAYWIMDYTDTVEGIPYSFLCVFYETETNFWRVMGCCPTEDYEENRDYLQKILVSAE